MTLREFFESRACHRIGWAYVIYWVLVSGFFIFAFLDEAIHLPPAPPLGEEMLLYGVALTIFPVLVPGMAVTAGLHGGYMFSRPPAFWILTVPTLAWAIIGWWTVGSSCRRWVKRSRRTPQ